MPSVTSSVPSDMVTLSPYPPKLYVSEYLSKFPSAFTLPFISICDLSSDSDIESMEPERAYDDVPVPTSIYRVMP